MNTQHYILNEIQEGRNNDIIVRESVCNDGMATANIKDTEVGRKR